MTIPGHAGRDPAPTTTSQIHGAEIRPVRDYAAHSPRSRLYPALPRLCGFAEPQARRRSSILAAARELFAETGAEGVRIRPLAKRSGVTPPTIYNLVGGRTDVLQHAVEEALDAKIGLALHRAEVEGINPVLAYAETMAISIVGDPDYYQQIAATVIQPGIGAAILDMLVARKSAVFGAWLTVMRDSGGLRADCCDPASVGAIVARQQCASVMDWARRCGCADQPSFDPVSATALLLLGVVGPEEAKRIEARLTH